MDTTNALAESIIGLYKAEVIPHCGHRPPHARLGPECFYDHERHLKPTRVPDLTSLHPA